jgi:hypothetical protein
VRDAGVPRPDHLRARDFAVAAAPARHDLTIQLDERQIKSW